jgi:hypothetical protein
MAKLTWPRKWVVIIKYSGMRVCDTVGETGEEVKERIHQEFLKDRETSLRGRGENPEDGFKDEMEYQITVYKVSSDPEKVS